MWQEKTLDNYDGGFTYERWWIFEQTFQTPCGLQCKGLQCHSNMSYMGIEWTFENDMATIHCPYEKKECKPKHEYLQEHGVLRYDCGRNRCAGMCPVLGHELDKKRGNVFYDVKISYLRNDLSGTLFEGQVDTRIIKRKKLFEHPVSMDIRNGIQIVHASDMEKRDSENKRERRRQSRESAVRRLEKRRQLKEKEKKEQPVQLSLFDLEDHCSANLDILDKKRFL